MLGAIVGDIVGSRYEFHNIKTKEFELFGERCRFTDDTVMTLAVAQSLLEYGGDLKELEYVVVENMVMYGRRYNDVGYGGRFYRWLFGSEHEPYNSYGNGSAMRVSPVAYVGKTLDEVLELSHIVTRVTHNHPEGIKGADAIAGAIFLARQGKSKEEIKKFVEQYYSLDFTLDEIRDDYDFYEICQKSVPQAVVAFLESTDFEDCIRNAISIGGDSDTIADMAGAIAEAYYGEVPINIKEEALSYLDDKLKNIYLNFYKAFIGK